MEHEHIIAQLPYSEPFLFVDKLLHVDSDNVKGTYTFKKEANFYKGHFKNHPVTPGVILTECCAQIGLICLALHILIKSNTLNNGSAKIGMSSSEMEFYIPVYPDETVTVTSKKVYFRFHKLKCEVKMHNAKDELVCKGTIAGMLKAASNE